MPYTPPLRRIGLWRWLRIHLVRMGRRLRRFPTEPVGAPATLLLISAALVIFSTAHFPDRPGDNPGRGLYNELDFWEGVLGEAHGMLLDLLILGILFAVLSHFGARRSRTRAHEEEIRDFAGWGSEEAKHRIVGNIRRLNADGITEIDLSDCILTGADLAPYRRGKSRRIPLRLSGASLHRADLGGANLKRVDLRGANFFRTRLDGAHLDRADLREAENLSVAQLLRTESLTGTTLDPELAARLRKRDAARADELAAPSGNS